MTWVLRGHRVLVDGALRPAALHVDGTRIAAITAYDDPRVDAEAVSHRVEAGDHVVSPGVVDAHVHINEPGRSEWEGFATATEAAAAGGITTVVDMPLNCIPATTHRAAAETKRASLRDQLHVDVAFWGGVVPDQEAGDWRDLDGLAEFGVAGCKCFLCPSGVDEFGHVAARHLDAALPRLRDLGLPLIAHAEAPGPLDAAEAALALERVQGGADPRRYDTYLRSRPEQAEIEAIALLIELARKHRARVHVVHLAAAGAVPLIAEAQQQGVAISAETCLHYLTFAAEEIEDGATFAKCAPPIRSADNRERLWKALADGPVSMVVSDHSPCTPQLKRLEQGDFMAAWGGIAGLQLGLSALWTGASARGHDVATMARWHAEATADLVGLGGRKGRLRVGYDADIVVWDDLAEHTVQQADIRHRHKLTPYQGRTLKGRVHQTYVGGKLAYDAVRGFASRPVGSFVAVRR